MVSPSQRTNNEILKQIRPGDYFKIKVVYLYIMKTKEKTRRVGTADGFAYLTKRILVAKAQAAGRIAAKNAMETMGYVIVAEDGWVVRKGADGSIHRIKRIKSHESKGSLVFD